MKNAFLAFVLFVFASIGLNAQITPVVNSTNNGFTLEDLWVNYKYYPTVIGGYNSMNDGERYTLLEENEVVAYSYANGEMISKVLSKQDLLTAKVADDFSIDDYSFNADETMLLLVTKTKKIYRHSFSADYFIFDLKNKSLTKLTDDGGERLATFSPDGSKVAFMKGNNLYFRNLADGKIMQFTKDGSENKIINGAPDWVYEEEFSFNQAFEWSPDSRRIAFIKFDESDVKQFQLTYFGKLYPRQYEYKYPKAGEANSKVSVHIYDLIDNKIVKVDIGRDEDIYVPRIKWANPSVLSVQRLNRLQNHFEILFVNPVDGNSLVKYDETNKYYVEVTDNLSFVNLKKQSGFIITSEKDGYNHLYFHDMDGKLVKQLTTGSWDVIKVLGVDELNGRVYFTSAESSPMNRDLCFVGIKDGKITKLNSKDGTNEAEFSKGFKFYVNTYTNINTPPFITVNDGKGKVLYNLVDNKEMISRMNEAGYSDASFFTFYTEDKIGLNGWMIKPKDFDPKKKYPVLMYVYGGPGSQTVLNDWGWFNQIWFQMIAQKGYIVVSVDGRGTGARGEEFKKLTYLQLGKYEIADQINTAKYLKSLPFVDTERIGIFGWSFGGYMSTLAMTVGADHFKAGIAVAPVTNWRYYDNIYTERFMRTPQENGDNYDKNSPIFHTEKLKGKYLLVHGMTDDNVHVQNSMDLVTALVASNKQFDMQFYPNNNHGIYSGRNTRFHLYKLMTDFIYENL